MSGGLGAQPFCYVTTRGRRTGHPHTVEIWFAASGKTIYILSGKAADWVRNARTGPQVEVMIGGVTRPGTARVNLDPEEDVVARRLVAAKYAAQDDSLDSWAGSAFPVAIDLG